MNWFKRLFRKPEPTEEEIIELEDKVEWRIRQNRVKRRLDKWEDGLLEGADPDAVEPREEETKDLVDVLPTYYEYDEQGRPTGELNGSQP